MVGVDFGWPLNGLSVSCDGERGARLMLLLLLRFWKHSAKASSPCASQKAIEVHEQAKARRAEKEKAKRWSVSTSMHARGTERVTTEGGS